MIRRTLTSSPLHLANIMDICWVLTIKNPQTFLTFQFSFGKLSICLQKQSDRIIHYVPCLTDLGQGQRPKLDQSDSHSQTEEEEIDNSWNLFNPLKVLGPKILNNMRSSLTFMMTNSPNFSPVEKGVPPLSICPYICIQEKYNGISNSFSNATQVI